MIVQAKHKLLSLENGSADAQPSNMSASSKPTPIPMPSSNKVEETVFQSDMFAMSEPSKVELALEQISPDDLTPREALALLYELKQTLKN